MSFYEYLNDEDEKKKAEEGGSSETPLGQTFAAPAPTGQGAQTAKQPVDEGSGFFQNLNKFIDANKEKSEQFASGVVGGVRGQYDKARQAVGTDFTNTQKQIQGNTFSDYDAFGNKVVQDAGNLSDAEMDKARQYLSGQYRGPTGFTSENLYDLDQGTQRVVETGSGAEGLSNAQNQFYKDKNVVARAGERNFDNLLLQRDPNAQKQINQAVEDVTAGVGSEDKNNDGVVNYLDSLQDTNNDGQINWRDVQNSGQGLGGVGYKQFLSDKATDLANEASAFNQKAKQEISNRFNTTYGTESADVSRRVKAANDNAQTSYEKFLNSLNKSWEGVEGVDGDTWKWSGGEKQVDDFGGWNARNITGQNYVSRGQDNTWRNVISAQEQARLNALASLINQNQYLGDLSSVNNAYSFDQARYDADIAKIEQERQDAINRANQTRADVADLRRQRDEYREEVENPSPNINSASDAAGQAADPDNIGWGYETVGKILDPKISTAGAKTTISDAADKLRPSAENIVENTRPSTPDKTPQQIAAEAAQKAQQAQQQAAQIAAQEAARRAASGPVGGPSIPTTNSPTPQQQTATTLAEALNNFLQGAPSAGGTVQQINNTGRTKNVFRPSRWRW